MKNPDEIRVEYPECGLKNQQPKDAQNLCPCTEGVYRNY